MTTDAERTEANRDAVLDFLRQKLGGKWTAGDPGDDSGIYLHSNQPSVGRLHFGGRLLADIPDPTALVWRLAREGVVAPLRAGRSVQVTSGGTAAVP